jgi:hypothetical protein
MLDRDFELSVEFLPPENPPVLPVAMLLGALLVLGVVATVLLQKRRRSARSNKPR